MRRPLRPLPASALLLACSAAPESWPPLDPDVARLHREALVVDGHNDVPSLVLDYGFDLGMDGADPAKTSAARFWILGPLLGEPQGDELRTHTDLRRLREGGVDAQFFSIFAHPDLAENPGDSRRRALAMIEALEAQIARHASDLELARSATDVRRIVASGKIAALMGLEGGHAIDDDLAHLRDFHARGVRYMTLTWSHTHGWADASGDEPRHGGLTDFGRDVVREMNRLGMLVDVSHVSDETFWDTLEVTTKPVIASHSSARALTDVPRNMSDAMLQAVSENGGVVMINFGGAFIDPRKAGTANIVWDALVHGGPSPVPLGLLLDHIEHVARVAGVDHVGLGSDFDGTIFLPEGAADVAGFPRITAGLVARGWTEPGVRKLLGENLLRVFEAAGSPPAAQAPQ
jgi:membrane dipeptidase